MELSELFAFISNPIRLNALQVTALAALAYIGAILLLKRKQAALKMVRRKRGKTNKS